MQITAPELSTVEQMIPPIAQMLGIEPATALLALAIIMGGANLVGRMIPDDAVGFLAGVRRIAKVLGLFVPNRIATGVSVNDVAKAVVTKQVSKVIDTIESKGKQVLRDQLPSD